MSTVDRNKAGPRSTDSGAQAAGSGVDLESTPITRPEYIAAIVHLYRGEMARANVWRVRLDTTTNWALLSTGALLSFTFSQRDHSHLMLLIGLMLILVLLGYEARRFRLFDVWRARARMIEENFYGPILRRQLKSPKQAWGALVAADLLMPSFKITFWQAFRARLTRNYLPILLITYLAWWVKILSHPEAAYTLEMLRNNVERGQAPIPLWMTLVFTTGLFLFLAGVIILVKSHPNTNPETAYWPTEREREEHPISILDA